MEQWEPPMCGTIRIKNPKTLRRWMRLGWYQKELDEGYQFNVGCGRFTIEKCTCHYCRNRTRPLLQRVVDAYKLNKNVF